ncbi:MAG: hypothetical protein Q9227_002022 [Pyrenula ochraceoflavens]
MAEAQTHCIQIELRPLPKEPEGDNFSQALDLWTNTWILCHCRNLPVDEDVHLMTRVPYGRTAKNKPLTRKDGTTLPVVNIQSLTDRSGIGPIENEFNARLFRLAIATLMDQRFTSEISNWFFSRIDEMANFVRHIRNAETFDDRSSFIYNLDQIIADFEHLFYQRPSFGQMTTWIGKVHDWRESLPIHIPPLPPTARNQQSIPLLHRVHKAIFQPRPDQNHPHPLTTTLFSESIASRTLRLDAAHHAIKNHSRDTSGGLDGGNTSTTAAISETKQTLGATQQKKALFLIDFLQSTYPLIDDLQMGRRTAYNVPSGPSSNFKNSLVLRAGDFETLARRRVGAGLEMLREKEGELKRCLEEEGIGGMGGEKGEDEWVLVPEGGMESAG